MASVEDITQILKAVQKESAEQMTAMMKQTMETMTDKLTKKDHSGGDDKINKPSTFKGEEKKYHEWMIKLLAYIKTRHSGSEGWIKWAMNNDKEINEELILNSEFNQSLDKVQEFSTRIPESIRAKKDLLKKTNIFQKHPRLAG